MDKQPQNLFPAAITKGAIEIFGEQSMRPVLLELLPATTVAKFPLTESHLGKILHSNEATIFSGYRFAKRQSEYLIGRICAKMAVQRYLTPAGPHPTPLSLAEIEITNATNGRPMARIHSPIANTLKMDISIAHSGDYGVALAANSICGIDLQRQEATLMRVQKKYCNEDEYRLLETFSADKTGISMPKRLNILWAAKEAAKKALSYWQMPGFLDLELRNITSCTNCISLSLHITRTKSKQMPKEVTVVANMFGEYALAICLTKEENKDAGTT